MDRASIRLTAALAFAAIVLIWTVAPQ